MMRGDFTMLMGVGWRVALQGKLLFATLMAAETKMHLSLLKTPSALLPMALGAAALTLPWLALAVFEPSPTGDEGAAARLFQLLVAAQIPCIVFFIAKWAAREPKQAMAVLVLQLLALVIPFVPVVLLEASKR
jgi:hypothetical protein